MIPQQDAKVLRSTVPVPILWMGQLSEMNHNLQQVQQRTTDRFILQSNLHNLGHEC